MTDKRIVLTSNARVRGVLRSPPEGEITTTEGEAKRLVQKEHVAKLAPGETWTKPAKKPAAAKKAAAPRRTKPAAAPTPAAAPASPAPAAEPAAASTASASADQA